MGHMLPLTCLKEMKIRDLAGGGEYLSTYWKQTAPFAFRQVGRAPSLEPVSHRFEMLGWVGEVTGVGWEFGESFIPCISKAVRLLRGGNDW